jgi:hypothetical protein
MALRSCWQRFRQRTELVGCWQLAYASRLKVLARPPWSSATTFRIERHVCPEGPRLGSEAEREPLGR